MLSYVIRRVLLMIPTLFFVAFITFVLAHSAPGSPFDKNQNRPLPEATIERLNRLYGIDQPIQNQFVLYLNNLVHLDLGSSLVKDRTVADIIGSEFPVSAQLGLQALFIALAIALPLGIVSALKQNTGIDYASLLFATIGTTIPAFVIAIFAIFLFGVNLRWFPFIGWGNGCGPLPSCDLKRMAMPTVILSLGAMAFLTRITRASMLEAIRQDYVRTARSKGLREQVVIVGHVVKNAMIPVATIIGPATAGLITGSFIIEWMFNVPGLGREFVLSINRRDYPLIMGVYMLYATLIVIANLTVDIVYGWIDPRIKLGR
ncbi:MAG: ABC transporter permease [Chloroflexota bacterium]|nr:ABC transporter permease [Chloroflexota bacterium]MDE3192338.1 ABC transporter permease [Chloroflexota bacterium]